MYKGRFHLLRWGNTKGQVCSESRHIELVIPVVAKENSVQHAGLELQRGLDQKLENHCVYLVFKTVAMIETFSWEHM